MRHRQFWTLVVVFPSAIAMQACVATHAAGTVEGLRSARAGALVERAAREPAASPQSAFERHRRQGTGRYLGRDDIARLNMHRLSDVLRTLPGVGVASGPSAQLRFNSNGSRDCSPEIWIDGTPTPSARVDDVALTDVEGLEIYRGPAGVPPELLSGSSRGGCGTLALWTRH